MSSFPIQSRSNATVFSSANAGQGGCSVFQYKNSPFQNVSANQVSALGVTAYKRLRPPLIYNADTIAKEEGYIGYDQDSERLCYTDSTLAWRCLALVDELPSAGLHDMVSAMLLVTNTVTTATSGYSVPTTGYKKLIDWTTTSPLIGSSNFNTATGIYTASTAGKFQVNVQASWRETNQNTAIRILRIIHTSTLAVTTIMSETVTNPSPNKNVNTVQQSHAGILLAVGETIHVEVAQTSGVDKDVEGGATLGSSGTTLQIIQVS